MAQQIHSDHNGVLVVAHENVLLAALKVKTRFKL
jgi:hypothetical protein